MYLNSIIQKNFLIISSIIITISYLYSSYLYSGNKLIFFLFFFTFYLYLLISFFLSDLFFDKVLSTFLWLGFYLTVFFKITFGIFVINEGEGNFKFLPGQFDLVLIWTSVGILAFIFSSIFHRFVIKIKELNNKENFKLIDFYNNYKYKILFLFFILIILVNFYNFKFEIYQKGILPTFQTNPFLQLIVKFFVIFGLTSISTILIDYDIKSKDRLTFLVLLIFYFEIITTNSVLLSRSFIFIGGFILLSTLVTKKIKKENTNYFNSFLINIIFFTFLYIISIQAINSMRIHKFMDPEFIYSTKIKKINKKKYQDIKEFYFFSHQNKKNINLNEQIIQNKMKVSKEQSDMIAQNKKDRNNMIAEIEKKNNSITFKQKIFNNFKAISILIQSRFVGFEPLAIVTSSNRQSKDAFWSSFKEKINTNHHQSYYSINFMNPLHRDFTRGSSKQVSVFLPGIIAFVSYYGSLVFLFISLLLIHFFSAFIEKIAYSLSFNSKIFSSFVGYTLAYRLIHFGYVPKNSYMLLTAIFISIFGIFIISKLIKRYY